MYTCSLCNKPVVEGQARHGATDNHYNCEQTLRAEGVGAFEKMDKAIAKAQTALDQLKRKMNKKHWSGKQ